MDLTRTPLLDDDLVRTKFNQLLGKPIGPPLLQDIKTIIVDRYKAVGHPFLDVGFPQQDVTNGTLQVVVTEFRVGQVMVEGNKWFTDRLIRRRSGLAPGDTIDNPALSKRLEQFNSGSFIQVTPEFKPGDATGTTDVTLRAQDHLPIKLSANYDNSGGPTTGWDRWTLGVTWGDAFWQGHTLGYQLGTSSNFWTSRPKRLGQEVDPNFATHNLSWDVPLPWGDTISLSGAYTTQSPNLGPDLGSVGLTETGRLSYKRPMGELKFGDHLIASTQELGLAYDYKRTNNDLSFGGTTINHGFSEVSQFSLQYTLTIPDDWGQSTLTNTLVHSPGGMTYRNTDAAFQPNDAGQSGTVGAKARYSYARVMLTRLVPLPSEFGLQLRVSGQIADQTLLPSEQLSIAGVDTVRGYQEGSITGSSGFVTSIELDGPKFSPSGLIGVENGDAAQLHVFWDYGQGSNRTPSSGSPANLHTSSIGFGGRYLVGENATIRMEQGWQLYRTRRQAAGGAFGHFSVSLTW